MYNYPIENSNVKIDDEINLKEVSSTLSKYKLSIFLTVFLFLIAAIYILYFKVPMYNAHTLIEVRSGIKTNVAQSDFIGNTFTNLGAEKVDKEIEILKTFHINNHAIDKIDFKIQFFLDDKYKKIEITQNIPVIVKDINITNNKIVGKLLKLTPKENGYFLHVQNSIKDRILHSIFDKEMITLKKHFYTYEEEVSNEYFKCKIEKKDTFNQSIYFKFKGDNRTIYETISKHLSITQTSEFAPLIRIDYEDTNAKRASDYTNALVESFIDQSILEKSKSSNSIINFVKTQIKDTQIDLRRSEDELEAYRIKHRAINPSLQGQVYINELTRIEIELSKSELRTKLIDDIIKFSGKRTNLASIGPALKEVDDIPTLNLVSNLQQIQIDMEGLTSKYSRNHPDITSLRNRISKIKKKIISNLKKLKSNMTAKSENLKKLKDLYDNKLKTIPVHERKLINLKRDYEVSSGIYKYLLQKKAENEMTNVAILSDYNIIDKSFINEEPVGAKPLFILIAFILLGLTLGILQALIRNYINDDITSKEDITKSTNIPIYGILPQVKQKLFNIYVFNNPKSSFSESYRSLRTNLQFSQKGNKGNIILITSTTSGEGKSTTTANLAAIFQIANYKSIVINLDMRKPTLHRYYGLDNTVGMSTYLSNKNNINEIILKTKYDNLDIITSGPIPPNPSELILTEKLEILLEELREIYDYIFIDSAPLGLVTDSIHLMKYSDMNIIVLRENYSNKSYISDLNKLIVRHELKNIGIVLNGASSFSSGYEYGV